MKRCEEREVQSQGGGGFYLDEKEIERSVQRINDAIKSDVCSLSDEEEEKNTLKEQLSRKMSEYAI